MSNFVMLARKKKFAVHGSLKMVVVMLQFPILIMIMMITYNLQVKALWF